MKANIHRPKTIDEAIDDLHMFLDSDLWYAIHAEFKNEKKMCEYLDIHFKILKDQIKYIRRKENENKRHRRTAS